MGRQRGGRDLKTCLEDLVALCPALLGAGWQETGVKPRKASCQREGRSEGGRQGGGGMGTGLGPGERG